MTKKKFETDRPTFAEINAIRKPRTTTVWLPIDAEVLDRIEDLERDLRIATGDDEREHRVPKAPAIKAELEALRVEAEAETAAVAFKFGELPRKQWRDLIDTHRSEDPARRWDENTFAPAAIAASCLEPQISADEAQTIWDEWGTSHGYVLFSAAVMVNEETPKVPFSVTDTAANRDSQRSSTTAPPEE